MKKRRRLTKKRRSHFWLYLVTATFIASTTASYLYFKPMFALETPFIEDIETQNAEKQIDEQGESSLRLYDSGQDDLFDNDVNRRANLLVTAEDIIRRYMGTYSVRLLDLYMDGEGTIYADFGSELRKNFGGDAFDEYQIIARLYKSIEKNVQGFSALKILIEGKEVESFGGHIDISRPIGEDRKGGIQRKTNRYF